MVQWNRSSQHRNEQNARQAIAWKTATVLRRKNQAFYTAVAAQGHFEVVGSQYAT